MFYECILTTRFAGMGNLLKVLTREIENYPHFFLDFESKCVAAEEEMWRGDWMDGCMIGGAVGSGFSPPTGSGFTSAALFSLLLGLLLPSPRLGVETSYSVASDD